MTLSYGGFKVIEGNQTKGNTPAHARQHVIFGAQNKKRQNATLEKYI